MRLQLQGWSIPKSEIRNPKFPLHLLTLSAKSEEALLELVERYEAHLAAHPTDIADICFTANTGRAHFNHRIAVLAESKHELRQNLAAFPSLAGQTVGVYQGQAKKRPQIAFLFTGQGSQYVDMGRQLYESHPIFRRVLDQCDEILRLYLDQSLLSILYPDRPSAIEQGFLENGIHETAYTQPALFALEYALVQLWKSWGIEPDVVMGHSVGEYVAACVAGVFSLEDGLKLIAEPASSYQQVDAQRYQIDPLMLIKEQIAQACADRFAGSIAVAPINWSKWPRSPIPPAPFFENVILPPPMLGGGLSGVGFSLLRPRVARSVPPKEAYPPRLL